MTGCSRPGAAWHSFVDCNFSKLSICRESAETIVLLEAILDGLSDETSGAKRDLCANAAREFLIWSAKHIPMPRGKDGRASSHTASSNLNAASLLRRLFERLAHPEAYQRYASRLSTHI